MSVCFYLGHNRQILDFLAQVGAPSAPRWGVVVREEEVFCVVLCCCSTPRKYEVFLNFGNLHLRQRAPGAQRTKTCSVQ